MVAEGDLLGELGETAGELGEATRGEGRVGPTPVTNWTVRILAVLDVAGAQLERREPGVEGEVEEGLGREGVEGEDGVAEGADEGIPAGGVVEALGGG